MKEMMKYLKPYWKVFILATAAMVVSILCELMLPAIMSDILNRGVQEMNFDYILLCCGKMLIISVVGFAAVLIGSKLTCNVVNSFCADVRSAVFRRVHSMTFEEFGKMGTAALVTRATHDVETVSWMASELSGTLVMIPVQFIGGVALAMAKDVTLSLAMLVFVPVILAVVLAVGKRILPLWEKSDEYIDKQNDLMRQRLRGIRVIRAFNAEHNEHRKIRDFIAEMSESFIKGNVAMGLISPLASFLLNAATVLIVYLSGWRMETQTGLTGADVFAIVQYVGLVAGGVLMGSFSIIMIPQVRVASDRIGQILHSQAMADPVARQDIILSGEIEFQNVSFRYDGAEESALKDINLHIRAGQKVAVIGGTGSGKSTLVSMLLGFRMPTQGQVLLDGMPTTQLSRHTMRQNMSCVLQNSTIYSGTVRENVKMGKLDASDGEILEALEIAQAREFVDSYSDSIDHEIKQSGKNLSGGQKQRLSIARAVLKNAPIYIFDDSFSALDFLTEANLRVALGKRIAGRTQIVITQRVTSAMHCDSVYVMDKGHLVDCGTHAELLGRCTVYREIYASQTGGAV